MYFYEQKVWNGSWSPRVSADYPRDKTPEGAKVKIRNVVAVPKYLSHLTVSQLCECFSEDGRFRSNYRELLETG